MKKIYLPAVMIMMMAMTSARPAAAQETSFGHITMLQTGSIGKPFSVALAEGHPPADDTLLVMLDVPFVNSADQGVSPTRDQRSAIPCKNTFGSYALDPKDTGVKVNESVLLSAYLAGRRVQLTLSGCVFEKPRIISVTLSLANN